MSIDKPLTPLSNDRFAAIVEAIRRVQGRIRWRRGKDIQHFSKRIKMGHLATEATIVQYESIIKTVINDGQAQVYIFQYGNMECPTLITSVQGRMWLVMIGLDGVMETAFPPHDPDTYLSDPAYRYIGVLEELL